MGIIHILPDFLANQIAAGEVVQRPESVVKELIENSLDAEATSIAVLIKNAGKQLIHVIDNGKGMDADDLLLSIKRHSTSKIFSSEDLEAIRTYGFRGEALASISSVAQIEIRSKQTNAEIGHRLIAEPTKEPIIEPFQTDNGTQVFIRNLFFNTPARRKFLKSNLTEFRYISDTMIRFALSNLNVRFTFYDEDTLAFDLKPASLPDRIKILFGEQLAKSLLPLSYSSDKIQIDGYIANPQYSKKTSTNQYFFLNGRFIKSKNLNFAVFSAMEHLIEKNQYPFFVINIKLDPRDFDVNVHPQKLEVKFEDERTIFNAINKAVANSLKESNLVPPYFENINLSNSPFEKEKVQPIKTDDNYIYVNKLTGEIIDKTSPFTQKKEIPTAKNYNYERVRPQKPTAEQIKTAFDLVFKPPSESELLPTKDTQSKNELFQELENTKFITIHNKYIIFETNQGIIIIDQHAGHERVLYEKALQIIQNNINYSKPLLFPKACHLSITEAKVLEEIQEELHKLGFELKFLTENSIEIKAVPQDIPQGYEEKTFREILEHYKEYQQISTLDKIEKLAASFSCKSAVKTGDSLSEEEIKHLIKSLKSCENPYTCPHGRPTIIEIKISDLDKRFSRS